MILAGIVAGLGSAVGGGMANVAITLASRRIGVLPTYVGAQLAALATMLLIAVAAGRSIPLDSGLPAAAFAVACISTLVYLAFFSALRLGPVSVVSPVVGAYGGIAVVLAVIVFAETLSAAQAIAVGAAVVGVILASVTVDRAAMRVALRGPGPALAVAAALGFAVNVTAVTVVIREYGWLQMLVVWRVWMALISLLVLTLVLAWRRARLGQGQAATLGQLDRRLLALIAIAGIFDTVAVALLAIGLDISFAWLVGLLSSLGPMSGAVWGLFLFGERLTRAQVVGIVLVGFSLVVLALG